MSGLNEIRSLIAHSAKEQFGQTATNTPLSLAGIDTANARQTLENLRLLAQAQTQPEKTKQASSVLETSLAKAINDNKASDPNSSTSLVLWNLSDPSSASIEFDADKKIRIASVIKLFILCAVLEKAKNEKISLDTNIAVKEDDKDIYGGADHSRIGKNCTIRQLIEAMITKSDNETTNTLVRWLGGGNHTKGFETVNNWSNNHGFNNTILQRKMGEYPYDATPEDKENFSTARDVATLLQKVYKHEIIDAARSELILDLLKRSEKYKEIPAGIDDERIVVANKVGEITIDDTKGKKPGVSHDASIIFDGKNHYLLVVLTETNKKSGDQSDYIASLSKIIYQNNVENQVNKFLKLDIDKASIEELRQGISKWIYYKSKKWETTSPGKGTLSRLFKGRLENAGIKISNPESNEVYDKVLQVLTKEEIKELAKDIQQGKSFLRVLYEGPAKNVKLSPDILNKSCIIRADFNNNPLFIQMQVESKLNPERLFETIILVDTSTGNSIEIKGDISNAKYIPQVIEESKKLFSPDTKKITVGFIEPQFKDNRIVKSKCFSQDPSHKRRARVNVSVADIAEKPAPGETLSAQTYLGERVDILDENDKYFFVKTTAAYAGWVKKEDVVEGAKDLDKMSSYFIVKGKEVSKKREAEIKLEKSGVVVLAPFSSVLEIISETQENYLVELPDGRRGFISKTAGEARKPSVPLNPTGNDVVELAKKFLGTPYTFWHYTPGGTNCAHMIFLIYKYLGISIPMDADLPYFTGKPVEKENLQPGDVVFFRSGSMFPTHVGIYIGDGKFIHNSPNVDGTNISSLDSPFYSQLYMGARRYIYPGAPKDFQNKVTDEMVVMGEGDEKMEVLFKKEVSDK